MSIARTLVVVLLVALLAVDLAAANAAIAADRTVLNPDFVTASLEEEGAYESVEPLVLESMAVDELGAGGDAPPFPVDPEVVVAAAIDPTYLQSQVEPNVERTYAYLHGNADELDLAVDVTPAKTAIVEAVEAELVDASAAELLESVSAGDGEELSVEAGGVTLDLQRVGEMAADEAVFEAERAELRTAVRLRVIDGLVEEVLAGASDDELLALVIEDYDPSAYTEAEKAQLVEERDPEIRAALRAEIEAEDEGEIAAAVDDQLAGLREEVRAEVPAAVEDSLGEAAPALVEPTTDLVLVAVDGYVADVSHATFSAEFEAAADDLAVGATAVLAAQLDAEVPDRVDLTEELDPSAEAALEEARRAVRAVDLLSLGLPALALLLVGAIYLVSRSVAAAAVGTGLALAIGGLPALVGAGQLRRLLEATVAGPDLPAGVAPLVLALAGRVADAVVLQSAVVVGLGVLLVGVGLAVHFDLLEAVRKPDPA